MIKALLLRLAILLASVPLLTSCEQMQDVQDPPQPSASVSFKSFAIDFQEAFNKKDVQALSPLFAPDATLTNLTAQQMVVNQSDIALYFSSLFTQYPHLLVKISPKATLSIDATHATENGTLVLSFDSQPAVTMAYKIDYINKDGSWYIQRVRAIELQPAPSHYEHLKELAWLAGNWKNTDESIVFSSDNRWDHNKNFLIQSFSTNVLDTKQLSGEQLIGWDPAKRVIHSWIFDSDGGYGTATWSNEGKTWYANTLYTLPDGQRASATHVYTKVNDDTYTFASIGRDVNGRVLPDIGPFKVVRTEAGQ